MCMLPGDRLLVDQMNSESEKVRCKGSCHCGRVEISVLVPLKARISRCNCSICGKSGHLHLIIPAEDFELLKGEGELTEYRFNTGTARHLFCRHCGVKTFYVPRSHPEGFSVNVQCLELDERVEVSVKDFDGQHWKKNISTLHGTDRDA